MQVLNAGYVNLIEHMGGDKSVIQNARRYTGYGESCRSCEIYGVCTASIRRLGGLL